MLLKNHIVRASTVLHYDVRKTRVSRTLLVNQ
jgi:hypothetical protein